MMNNGKKRMVRTVGIYCAAVTAALVITGCIPQPGDDESTDAQEQDTVWSDGLTPEQVIKAMPIIVNEAAPAASEETGVASAKLALTDATQTDKDLLVTWAVPAGALPFSSWTVYEGDGQSWNPISADIQYSETWPEVLEIEKYPFEATYYWFNWKCTFTTEQHIKYFRIVMTDHNGDKYENIVSFMVWPYTNPIQITLSDETEAEAASDISIMLNGGWDSMWKYTQTTELPLTETIGQDIDPWTSVRFQIATDFTGWGFEENLSTHVSNSSFCKVTKVDPPNDTVQSRLKYSFEDLPIDQVGQEPTKEFDYNDVVLYVDIMKL
jgi:hypothetical protein